MDLVNKRRALVQSIHGDIVTITHRRGGTSKVTVDRGLRYKIGDLVCFTVDPVHQEVTGIMLKKKADAIVEKAVSEELQVADTVPDGFPLEDDQDDEEIDPVDPVDRYYGEEEFDHDEFCRQGQIHEGLVDHDCGENREPLIDESDYFGDALED